MKKEAESNGWNAIAIRHDHNIAYFKKFDKSLKSMELRKVGEHCDIYIYNPNLNIDEYNPLDKNIKGHIAKIMNLTAMMFELIPLFSYISEDPMPDTF